MLRYFDDLSVAETAAVLGCSEGTVKSQPVFQPDVALTVDQLMKLATDPALHL